MHPWGVYSLLLAEILRFVGSRVAEVGSATHPSLVPAPTPGPGPRKRNGSATKPHVTLQVAQQNEEPTRTLPRSSSGICAIGSSA